MTDPVLLGFEAIPTEDVGATVTIHPFSLDTTSLSQVVESLESVLSTLPASLYSEGTSGEYEDLLMGLDVKLTLIQTSWD